YSHMCSLPSHFSSFFFNAPPPTEIYTLSLHDALPISAARPDCRSMWHQHDNRAWSHPLPVLCRVGRLAFYPSHQGGRTDPGDHADRKSTRLNSSHVEISYAVFCLKKKKKKYQTAVDEE